MMSVRMTASFEEGKLERPNWAGETNLSRLVAALIGFKPLYSLLKLGARQVPFAKVAPISGRPSSVMLRKNSSLICVRTQGEIVVFALSLYDNKVLKKKLPLANSRIFSTLLYYFSMLTMFHIYFSDCYLLFKDSSIRTAMLPQCSYFIANL
ncbi:hypothetical protein Tco_1178864, partial [Tanacetum coccineum]